MSDPIVSRLAEVQGRLDAATPGPWERGKHFRAGNLVAASTGQIITGEILGSKPNGANADLIAHAPADLVWALSVIRQQQETIEKQRADILREIADLMASHGPVPNYELNHDGSTDPLRSAYVEGQHDAWALVNAHALEAAALITEKEKS